MKKIFFFLAIAMVMACNRTETSIKVNKTSERYELVALYPTNREDKIIGALKASFKDQDSLLLTKSVSGGKEITLVNGTVFYLRYNPGKLEMEMLVDQNNAIGHRYFDQLVVSVKKALQ